MRDATHPAQSSAIAVAAIAACSIFLAQQLLRFGFTNANRLGVVVASVFAVVLWLARSATASAAAVGGLIVATLTLGTIRQPSGAWWRTALLPLVVLLLFTLVATHFRRGQKEQLGLAEPKAGRRASQVCANLGAASFAAILYASDLPRVPMLLALAAALVEATADTVSSETGQAMQGKTFLLTTGRMVAAGVDGGISLAGTVAGCAAGAAVAATSAICLGLSARQAVLCWGAGIAGIFFDSWLGATLERKGVLSNDAVNFLSTCCSALLAGAAGAMLV